MASVAPTVREEAMQEISSASAVVGEITPRVPPIAAEEATRQPADPSLMTASIEDGSQPTEVLTTFSFRKRKRGKSGPDSCLTPSSSTVMSRAVASAADREGEPVFFPYEGMTFNSYEAAREFYNLYSWEVGFGIRDSRSEKNSKNYTLRKDVVCSCQGFCDNPQAASARSGCKAMVRLHRTENHSWIVSKIVPEHNHPLSVTFGENKQWGSHSDIDAPTKEIIRKLRRNNVPLGRVCSIVGATSADSGLPIRKQAVRNLCARLAQEDIQDDMKKTVELLRKMHEEDNTLQVRFKTDANGRIEAMLWSTGKNQLDFEHFGDVVTFDTTYRTNLYNMPFGIFVGVNNHYQSIIFGGVLLTHERTEDFKWTFSNFTEIMGGKQPITILTDQCQAMASAIKSTLPGTRHRWCRWHVLRNAKQKIGPSYSKKSTFKKQFNRLITDEISPSEFEDKWHKLVEEYKLKENKFMERAFRTRGMWAKPYFMDIFCAGMTSTQRSESANHMLKRFIQRGAPMHVFVSKFRDFQFDRNQEEERENHLTKQMSRRRRFGVPIEFHAGTIYTRGMYERFTNELYESGAFTIHSKTDNCKKFVVVHKKALAYANAHHYQVVLTGVDKISCSCGLYEHTGLLCRHSLKVLVHLDRTEIPRENIMHRWTRQAGCQVKDPSSGCPWEKVVSQTNEAKRQLLVMRALELSGSKRQLDDSSLNEALQVIENIIGAKENREQLLVAAETSPASNMLALPGEMTLACPPRQKRTGRPRDTSQKSWKKHSKLEKEIKRGRGKENDCAEGADCGSSQSKTSRLSDLLQVTNNA